MATSSCSRSLTSAFKRLKLSPRTPAVYQQTRRIETYSDQSTVATSDALPPPPKPARVPRLTPQEEEELAQIRLPKAVQATYLAPLRHQAKHGIVAADLQLRSYSVRNLEVFADFALRAAYFLNLPAQGPQPLRKIVERYTVPRSNFVHKKSQENFERVTKRRWIRILDGNPKTVQMWLAFIRKYQYYGVGMKCDVWEHGGLVNDSKSLYLDPTMQQFEPKPDIENLALGGQRMGSRKLQPFKGQWGQSAPMGNRRYRMPLKSSESLAQSINRRRNRREEAKLARDSFKEAPSTEQQLEKTSKEEGSS